MKNLKQIIFLVLLATGSLGFSATLPTTITGGGSDFLEIDDITNPSTITVKEGTTDKYAGITGGTITYNYSSATREDKIAFIITEDFTVNSKIVATFDNPASYNERNSLTFNVANGKTLTLNDFEVNFPNNNSGNYIVFSKGTTILNTQGRTYTSLFQISYGTFENRGDFMPAYIKLTNGVLNLGGNFNVRSNAYMGKDGLNSSINLNGYDFNVNSVMYFEDNNQVLNVTFGNDANADGIVVFALNSMQQNFESSTTIFKDFDPSKHLVLLKEPFAEDLSLFVFEGYEGQEIMTKVLTAEDTVNLQIDSSYAGYTSYYVIPEPSIFAAFFGIAALALVVLKRRK